MNFTPDAGLTPSILISAACGFVVYVTLTTSIVRKQTELIGCVYTLPFAFGVLFGLFLLTFPIVNLVLQWRSLDMAWLLGELQNGGLALRATSFILVARAILDAYRYTRTAEHVYHATFRTDDRDAKEFELFEQWHTRSKFWLAALSRTFFYFVVLAVLWWLRILDVDNYHVAGLSYAVFFILDDAAIITGYSVALGGRVVKSHRIRLLIFDLILFCATLWQSACTSTTTSRTFSGYSCSGSS